MRSRQRRFKKKKWQEKSPSAYTAGIWEMQWPLKASLPRRHLWKSRSTSYGKSQHRTSAQHGVGAESTHSGRKLSLDHCYDFLLRAILKIAKAIKASSRSKASILGPVGVLKITIQTVQTTSRISCDHLTHSAPSYWHWQYRFGFRAVFLQRRCAEIASISHSPFVD